jgi:cysteine desulfurase
MRPSIYFDYNATTPLDAGVRAAMLPFLEDYWANPSSVHHLGQKARAALDDLRARAAAVLQSKPSELIFTSGGTEANNLAVFGTARLLAANGKHLITSSIEHHAVLHCFDQLERAEGFTVTRLPVDSAGRISPDDLRRAIRPDTILVSLMAANNEIGTIQPVAELGDICRDWGIVFHTDAVQWFGKLPFSNIHQFNADLVTLCPHKFHGPKGAGLLFVRSPLRLQPILFGGPHENEHRAGTENLAAIAGLVYALEKFVVNPVFSASLLQPLAQSLRGALGSLPNLALLGSPDLTLPNTVSFVAPDFDSISLLARLDLEGICASSGSACSAGSLEPSHVVSALGHTRAEANALVRFSLGRGSTAAEVHSVCSLLPGLLSRQKGAS